MTRDTNRFVSNYMYILFTPGLGAHLAPASVVREVVDREQPVVVHLSLWEPEPC